MISSIIIHKGGIELNDKVKFSPEQLISSTQLVRNLSKHLEQALDYPLFIQRNQEVEWVLMSLKDYEKLVKKGGKEK